MSDDDEPNSNNMPEFENKGDPYLTAILDIDAKEASGKINYEEIFAERDRRLNNGK